MSASECNGPATAPHWAAPQPPADPHGGNRLAAARRLGCRPRQLLDASASLVPFGPPWSLRTRLLQLLLLQREALRDYPDRSYTELRQQLASAHGLPADAVLPGNGAAELFTWAARDAAAQGTSLLSAPGFGDYGRALACWRGRVCSLPLPLDWDQPGPSPWPLAQAAEARSGRDGPTCLWLTNPHNPTGQLWSRASLEPLLQHHSLVIVDEAFLPLVPAGEQQSLIPLVARHPHLVVIRSLTKLLAVAGLRLGYAIGDPERLRRWASWRDPWPVNGLAAALGPAVNGDPRWLARVHTWVQSEQAWLRPRLRAFKGLQAMPSAANYLLLQGRRGDRPLSLQPLRQALEQRHRILLRDCRSFEGLDESWLRLSLLDRSSHQRLLQALEQEWPQR